MIFDQKIIFHFFKKKKKEKNQTIPKKIRLDEF